MNFNYHPSKDQIERRSSPIFGRKSWKCTKCGFWPEGEKTLTYSMQKYGYPICFSCQKKIKDKKKGVNI